MTRSKIYEKISTAERLAEDLLDWEMADLYTALLMFWGSPVQPIDNQDWIEREIVKAKIEEAFSYRLKKAGLI